ncbi:MAG: glutathione S-transferase family protein [Novosphingobium sp.]
MQIFGFPLSPFVRKVLVVAAEKGIEVDNVLFHPRQPPPEFLAASPFRKIPALRDGDYTLADSTAIANYLDALCPEPPILPVDARGRGKAVWFEEFADTIMVPAGGKVVFNRFVAPKLLAMAGDEEAAAKGEEELVPLLAYLESQAPADGWLAGEAFSIGDVAVASTLASLAYASPLLSAAAHPATVAWFERVKARPAWQQVTAHERKALASRVQAATGG